MTWTQWGTRLSRSAFSAMPIKRRRPGGDGGNEASDRVRVELSAFVNGL